MLAPAPATARGNPDGSWNLSTDPSGSTRRAATDGSGQPHPGVNRQQDSADDGEARWNLISRNGQDVVSGIYLFVVDSSQGQQRGKFVVAR